ncbi:hypothetical protein SAMN05421686_102221 [Thalassolituus maritimus]|uniref:Uncharacterized protein n=1 Tax=Thalassolituus maritimus TaxID=484498 RepID=A0A1N7JWB1_9GAMM|nr:hypothetical protein [Thalassolituus maritimus]SIS53623.1 hypothetical protein SAMN05421686_102221 [Thalassolituus maritimus]
MSIDDVYLSIAKNIVNAILDDWDEAVVDIERPAEDVISFSVSYFLNGDEEYLDFDDIDTQQLTPDGNKMSQSYTKSNQKLFDGSEQEFFSENYKMNISDSLIISPSSLAPLSRLVKLRPDDVTAVVGGRVMSFDNETLYRGTKKGTDLYYFTPNEEEDLYIFSLGEFQPSRFICIYNGKIFSG